MDDLKKRKRADSDSEQPTPQRHPRFWMPHGDIVVQVVHTQFRVNRDILAFQSPRSKAVPLVEMAGDTSQDWEVLLSVLYEPFQLTEPMALNKVAAMMRLGRKYEMDSMLQDAISRIRYDFPRKLEDWDEHTANKIEPNMDSASYLCQMLLLMYEFELWSSVPIATFWLIQEWPIVRVLLLRAPQFSNEDNHKEAVIENLEKTEAQVPSRLYASIAAGVERLSIHQKKALSWLATTDPIPANACITPMLCTDARILKYHNALWTPDSAWRFSVLSGWTNEWEGWEDYNVYFCPACNAAGSGRFDEVRKATWEALPRIFGFPAWDSLKDGTM
ncbi:BTB domain-containing protein [Mycena kentingensis (nom. inval.)]|nr:BTB domain-containing protein [Mycena kentingensis (nom. inval.)]